MLKTLWPLVAAVVLSVVGTAYGAYSTDVTTAKAHLVALETTKAGLFTNLTRLQTLLATAQERINRVQFRDNGDLRERNRVQQQLINTLSQQAKEAQHAADAANAMLDSAQDLAGATASELPDLTSGVGAVESDNSALDGMLDSLEGDLNTTEDSALSNLQSTVDGLNSSVTTENSEIDSLRTFLDSRNCEYGLVYLQVPSTETVNFNSNFDSTPSVATSIVGFRAHLLDEHSYGYGSYGHSSTPTVDFLGFNVTLGTVDMNSFMISVTEVNEDNVDNKDVYIQYMACQNLDSTV